MSAWVMHLRQIGRPKLLANNCFVLLRGSAINQRVIQGVEPLHLNLQEDGYSTTHLAIDDECEVER